MAYLDDHPPRVRQFRDRGTTVSGVIVLHTAESQADVIGPDTGAEGVASFIANRTTYGSYHRLCDSDSIVELVRLSQAAYGEGTGTNSHSMHISAAIQAAAWPQMTKQWRDATVRNMAKAAAEMSRYVYSVHGVHVPAKRISASAARNRVEGFLAHGDLDPGRRTDPGAAFPWDDFFAYYTEELGDDIVRPEDITAIADEVTKRLLGEDIKISKEDEAPLARVIRWIRNDGQRILRELRELNAKLDGTDPEPEVPEDPKAPTG